MNLIYLNVLKIPKWKLFTILKRVGFSHFIALTFAFIVWHSHEPRIVSLYRMAFTRATYHFPFSVVERRNKRLMVSFHKGNVLLQTLFKSLIFSATIHHTPFRFLLVFIFDVDIVITYNVVLFITCNVCSYNG